MIHRLLSPSKNSSFFIFGARGTGKSTFIQQQFLPTLKGDVIYYDLLDDETEERLSRNPSRLKTDLTDRKRWPQWIVIDEIQKIPRLLDVVHSLIETKKVKFVLTGSSARKLRKEGANLLGGRAFEYRLFPFSFLELKNFKLQQALNYGSLPGVLPFLEVRDKIKYLRTYVSSYIKLEVQMEQLVRKLDPFRNFIEIAAQMNGKALNYSKIAKEVGVDTKTVIQYYQILEETYLGFTLPGYHTSLRKSVLLTPKFYFFDVGVKRSLEKSLHSDVVPGTSYYGECFEHFVIMEIYKLNHYLETEYSLSYFSTKEGAEVDLVLHRGKKEVLFIEIKSSTVVDETEVRKLAALIRGTNIKAYYLSQDPTPQSYHGIRCLHWADGIKEIYGIS